MIAFLCVATELGGAERSLLEFLRSLREEGEVEPWVIVPRSEGPLLAALAEIGVQVAVVPMPKGILGMSRSSALRNFIHFGAGILAFSGYLARLIGTLRKRRPKLLHTTGIKCHFLGAWLGWGLGYPIVWHLRDILTPGPTRTLLRFTARFTRITAIANSRATLDSFGFDLATRARSTVIHNGLSALTYRPAPNRLFHAEFGIPVTAPLVGIVGVLARWKGQVEFIRMAERLIGEGTDAHFVIVGGKIYDTSGDVDYPDELRRLVEECGLSERLHFAGFRKDSVAAVNGLDLLVHASIRPEPFGRVVLEAMACGVPVVASRGGGIDEFVTEGETGLLVDPRDTSGFASAVARLLREPTLREKLVKAGQHAFQEGFTIERHRARIREVWEQVRGSK